MRPSGFAWRSWTPRCLSSCCRELIFVSLVDLRDGVKQIVPGLLCGRWVAECDEVVVPPVERGATC